MYDWIPVQCFVKIFTLAQFRDICEDRNIRPGQHLLVWTEPSPNLLLIRKIDNVMSIDLYILLEEGSDASVGLILQNMENLGV